MGRGEWSFRPEKKVLDDTCLSFGGGAPLVCLKKVFGLTTNSGHGHSPSHLRITAVSHHNASLAPPLGLSCCCLSNYCPVMLAYVMQLEPNLSSCISLLGMDTTTRT